MIKNTFFIPFAYDNGCPFTYCRTLKGVPFEMFNGVNEKKYKIRYQ